MGLMVTGCLLPTDMWLTVAILMMSNLVHTHTHTLTHLHIHMHAIFMRAVCMLIISCCVQAILSAILLHFAVYLSSSNSVPMVSSTFVFA